MTPQPTIVVDGSNIAYTERTTDGKPKVSNLVAVRTALKRMASRRSSSSTRRFTTKSTTRRS